MTTLTAAPEVAPVARPAREVPSRIPFARVLQVELIKMFDTRSGFWLMVSIVVSAVLATAAVIAFAPDDQIVYDNFGAAIGFPMVVILPVIAILSVTSEWSQRSGLTTFTLVPHRGRVVGAKLTVSVIVGALSIVVALGIGALGNLLGAAVAGVDPVWDISLNQALSIVLANVLGLLFGFMLGVLIRNSPGALVGLLRLLLRVVRPDRAARSEPGVVPRGTAVGGLQLHPGHLVRGRPDRRAVGQPGGFMHPVDRGPAHHRPLPGPQIRGQVARPGAVEMHGMAVPRAWGQPFRASRRPRPQEGCGTATHSPPRAISFPQSTQS